ncbi:DUF1990 family protein [Agromyces sp. CFH 90414]|uniref:DUF1990 family protein n=2 Tax=Agromyces agglutinans TaxID=2662258 RepID=A0A6I2F7L7_9MICO|nr:DUF1990 family protein [Agromyces agglutinans]
MGARTAGDDRPAVGTRPGEPRWPATGAGYRRSEISATIGSGDALWERATTDLMRWRVKTRSGFRVTPDAVARPGARPVIVARALGCSIREPVEVTEVARTLGRVGFAYRTLPGHPVDGEEAFILHRAGDAVVLTVRSLTRPARSGLWRFAYPLLRVAQLEARRRYLRALR